MTKEDLYFIIDFDSTFIQVESLETLAAIALKKNKHKNKILKKMEKITADGMTGKISFTKSLSSRIKLFKAHKKDTQKVIKLLKSKITPSVDRNRHFFQKYRNQIYIISGGFVDYIKPIFHSFGIPSDHILANQFIFDKKGNIIGFDKSNELAHAGGKVKKIKSLGLKGKVYVIGDGFTDYEIRKEGLADKFFVFCENVKREGVAEKGDYLLPNFDEFLYIMRMPASLSYPKNRIKVLLLENIHKNAYDAFKSEGYQVEPLPQSCDEEELLKKLKDIHVVGIGSRTQITPNVVKNAPKL